MPYTIVIADEIAPEAVELLKNSPHTLFFGMEHLPEADALIIRSVPVNAAQITLAPRLKIISRAGVGMDAVDLAYAEQKGVLCVNAQGGNSVCASEHTMGLMLALAHQTARSHNQILNHIWDRKTTEGFELSGKALGVVGCGNVGSKVVRLAAAFGMNPIVYDPYLSTFPKEALRSNSLDDLLRACDILTLHVPLTAETRGMVDARAFSLMKSGSCLVNASRGGVVDTQALLAAAPKLKGIALDVYEDEPLPQDSPLRSLPHIVMTAHLGGASTEARRKVSLMAAESVLHFFQNR